MALSLPPDAAPGTVPPALASLGTRLASLLYEVILLFAILFVASYLFLALARDAQHGWPRTVFQLYLLTVCGIYFVFCWSRAGQTLPMKTWRLRIEKRDGRLPEPARALGRYLLAVPGMLTGGSVLWVAFDRERQFLHDRLAGTRIVRLARDRQLMNSE